MNHRYFIKLGALKPDIAGQPDHDGSTWLVLLVVCRSVTHRLLNNDPVLQLLLQEDQKKNGDHEERAHGAKERK